MSKKIREQIQYEEREGSVFSQYPPGTKVPCWRQCPWCRQEYYDALTEEGAPGWELKEVSLPFGGPICTQPGITFRTGLWRLTCLKCGWVAEFKEL